MRLRWRSVGHININTMLSPSNLSLLDKPTPHVPREHNQTITLTESDNVHNHLSWSESGHGKLPPMETITVVDITTQTNIVGGSALRVLYYLFIRVVYLTLYTFLCIS